MDLTFPTKYNCFSKIETKSGIQDEREKERENATRGYEDLRRVHVRIHRYSWKMRSVATRLNPDYGNT